jgi:site-specific recombinase XerD
VEEIIAVMRRAPDDRHGARLRALIVVLWRGGLRVQEALAPASATSIRERIAARAPRQGWPSARDRHGRLGLGAAVALAERPDRYPSDRSSASSTDRRKGRPWSSAGVRVEFGRLAAQAGVRRRFAPHQLRHAHALELAATVSR